jgi:hypothetical protein
LGCPAKPRSRQQKIPWVTSRAPDYSDALGNMVDFVDAGWNAPVNFYNLRFK